MPNHFTIRIKDPKDYARVKRVAKSRHQTVSDYIRMALDERLQKDEKRQAA
jgi:hypothetical protein